jgi:hypothetical protein
MRLEKQPLFAYILNNGGIATGNDKLGVENAG